MTCTLCAKPLGKTTVGLNGKDYHIECFDAAVKAKVKPVMDAVKRLLGQTP